PASNNAQRNEGIPQWQHSNRSRSSPSCRPIRSHLRPSSSPLRLAQPTQLRFSSRPLLPQTPALNLSRICGPIHYQTPRLALTNTPYKVFLPQPHPNPSLFRPVQHLRSHLPPRPSPSRPIQHTQGQFFPQTSPL